MISEIMIDMKSRVTRYMLHVTRRAGFTLIEAIVVIGAISVALPVIFGLFFTSLQSRTKVLKLQQIKENGDFALTTIQNLIRQSATGTYQDSSFATAICTSPGLQANNPVFSDSFGNWFQFYATGENRIASDGAVTGQVLLTSPDVSISGFGISCERQARYGPPLVTIQFQVSQVGTPARIEETAKLNYQTKVKLRSY